MRTRIVAQVGIAVLLVLAGVGGWLWVAHREHESRIGALELEAKRLLAEEQPDREGITAHLRTLGKHPLAASEPRLLRARARLELTLDRPQQAIEILEGLVTGVDATAEDLALGAEARGRMHALGGKVADAFRAMSEAERASDKLGGDAALLLRAWQYGIRAGHPDDATRIAERLAKIAPDSIESRFVALLRSFDPAEPRGLPALLELDQQLGHFEPELAVAIVTLELQKGDDASLADAIDRVKLGIRILPTSKELRHVAAVAFHSRGDQPQRDLHLRWLLENAPQDDRAGKWGILLQTPIAK